MSDTGLTPYTVPYKVAADITGKSVRTIQYAVSAGCLETRGEGKGRVILYSSIEPWADAHFPIKLGRR